MQFIEPLLAEVLKERGDVTLADHGAGKSYLGFILYDLFFKGMLAATAKGPHLRHRNARGAGAKLDRRWLPGSALRHVASSI